MNVQHFSLLSIQLFLNFESKSVSPPSIQTEFEFSRAASPCPTARQVTPVWRDGNKEEARLAINSGQASRAMLCI